MTEQCPECGRFMKEKERREEDGGMLERLSCKCGVEMQRILPLLY